jgi:hypothetical protein
VAPPALAVAAVVLVLVGPAPGQEIPPRTPAPRRGPVYADQSQVAALNSYVTTVLGSAAQPDDLLQLSRLLSEPRDQILWLIEQVRWLGQQAGGSRQAQALAETTEQRIALWDSRGVRGLEPLAELLERTRTEIQPALPEIIHPPTLAAALDQIDPSKLSAADSFRLLARGVPASRLNVDTTRPSAWDMPRVVVATLAERGDGSLPPFWKLLDLDRELRTARQRMDAGLPDAPARVADTFRIAEALLGRALGVDDVDRSPSGDDLSDNWGILAAQLEEENLWEWAALTRLLQAAAIAGAQGRQQIAAAARDWCAQTFLVVDPQALPALHKGNTAWLARLEGGELEAAGVLPLSRNFRQRARQARVALEQQFLAARADHEQAFRLMQLAKAAELGLGEGDVAPVTIEELKQKLKKGDRPDGAPYPAVHLYLEFLEVAENCYGLALYSVTAGRDRADSFGVASLGPDAPERIVAEALSLVRSGGVWRQGKILIAPDGSTRTANWLETGEQAPNGAFEHLPQPPGDTRSWVVYVPTAGALNKDNGWTLERALRLWYQSGMQSGRPGIDFLRSGRGRTSTIKSFILQEERLNAKLYAISVGGAYPSDLQRDYLTSGPYRKLLMSAKKSGTHTNVLAMIVAE